MAKRKPTPWIETDSAARVGNIHRWVAYFLLLVSNAACLFGVITYLKNNYNSSDIEEKGEKHLPIALITLPLFGLLLAILELNRRIFQWTRFLDFGHKANLPSFTQAQISKMINDEKRHIVIADNFVLDYGDFDLIHPGGRFVLEKNIGRDISKFFYGGYKMTNTTDARPHQHS
jgi:hypothetical protein